LVIRDTSRYGKGVFAISPIEKGRAIHVLAGRKITLNEFIRLVTTDEGPLDDPLQVGVRIHRGLQP
jgi:hypothetical protein